MVFSSTIFLFIFLPLVLLAYYIVPAKRRNLILLLFSYIFYLWGGGWFLFVLIFSTLCDYILAQKIEEDTRGWRRYFLMLSLFINLSILVYFKYSNFIVNNFNDIFFILGTEPIVWTRVILPIGISFFIFQKITYVVDVYRGAKHTVKNFTDLALYVAMFPQLVAGPIVRFHEISHQISHRRESTEMFTQGIIRFFLGILKKVILANACGEIADAVFDMDSALLSTQGTWLGVTAYTLQIYFDFSAYTDMAIGLGQMFGFRLPENFNRPYSAISITDFWRRWHITLSNFFREYVYVSLGGNRLGSRRTYLNLMAVFLLCGMWHGANATFLFWGLYHGALLIIERIAGLRDTESVSFIVVRRAVTLLLVMIGWVFFRADNLNYAFIYLKTMFTYTEFTMTYKLLSVLNNRNITFLILASIVFFLPRNFSLAALLNRDKNSILGAAQFIALIVLFIYSIMLVVSGSYNPFIYFQF